MRVKNVSWIYVLGISVNVVCANDTNLQDFINKDDFEKMNLILASEPVFDVNEEEHTLINPSQSESIPSVHRNPLDIQIDNITSPIFTEEHIIIPDIDDVVIQTEDTEDTDNSDFTSDTHNESEINTIISNEPTFTEDENVPSRKNEDIPSMTNDNESADDFIDSDSDVSDIISVNPEFTEDENVPSRKNEDIPSMTNDNESADDFIDSDSDVSDIISVNPEFTEDENVPERKTEQVSSLDTFDNILGVDDVISTDSVESRLDELTLEVQPSTNNTEEVVVVDVPLVLDTPNDNEWKQNITDLGNSWYYVEWFGHFFSTVSPSEFGEGNWIYHVSLGWVFISSESFTSVWIYSDKIQEWMWTSNETYPYTSVHSESDFPKWLYFDLDRGVVYDFESSKYFDIN
jgi:hypothetical protein